MMLVCPTAAGAVTLSPVAAGAEHTCALTSVSGVQCWGDNSFGQLGDGSTTNRLTPVDVIGLSSDVVSVVAMYGSSCALTRAGAVKCWGYNAYGALGDGTTTSRLTPVGVSGLASGVVQIAAADAHVCAVTGAGALKCWGVNSSGELGDGTTTDRRVPVDVVGLTAGVAGVAAGLGRTCALTDAGGLKCWGRNLYGQLGDGTTIERHTPVDVLGYASGVTGVSLGSLHTCVLDGSGGLKCWGANFRGQVGDGTRTTRPSPVDVLGLTAGVAQVAAGDDHTCALTTTDEVMCWGLNFSGQLGDGTTTERPAPVAVGGLPSGVEWLAAGQAHTCSLSAAGQLRCWGSNAAGRLGSGIPPLRSTPVVAVGLTGDDTPRAGGSGQTCALTGSGGLKCWGSNYYGQLGDGTTVDRPTAVGVSGLASQVSSVAAGNGHTCAVTTSGAAKCWGLDYYGQLGDGGFLDRQIPTNVFGLGSGVAGIAAGDFHSCAVTTAGSAKCWGQGGYGQLGDGTRTDRRTPVDVTGLSTGVASISSRSVHTCVRTTAGGVKCWGLNQRGQLGDGTTTDRLTPVNVSGLASGVSALTSGLEHTCALVGGGVRCWGDGRFGQTGDGVRIYRPSPVSVSGLTAGVSAIAAGDYHTCALTSAGGVKCWGLNTSRQLGDGTEGIDRLTPVDVIGLTEGVVAIAAGDAHSCALTATGEVRCWGSNARGGLGNGELGYAAVPTDVVGFTGIVLECGNGILDPGEACDDGNTTDDDCCSADCQLQNAPSDLDADGICNDADNCPATYNPDQRDSDASAGGDLCDVCPSDAFDGCAAAKTRAETIDDGGGMLEVPDQSLTLDFPAGTLAGPTSVSATGGLPDSGFGLKLLPDKSPLAFELQPSGRSFDPPVGVTFRWQDANDNCFVDNPATSCPVESRDACATSRDPACDLPVRESDLKIFRNGAAFPLVGTTCASDPWKPSSQLGCNPDTNQWTIAVDHFSEYVLGQCAAAKQRRLTLDGLGNPRGDETLRLRGRMDVESPADPAIDPIASGFALVVERARPKKVRDPENVTKPKKVKKRTLYEVQVPGGAYDEATGTGWRKKPNRDLWTYASSAAKGVTRASVLLTDGRVKFDVTAAGLKLRKLKKKDLPLVARFVLDGRCGDASFAGPAPAPVCVFSDARQGVSCQ